MPDRHDETLRILIVDDRRTAPSAWSREAPRVDPRIHVRIVGNTRELQHAILDGRWLAVLCNRALKKLSINGVLTMLQVVEPPPAILLYADPSGPEDHRAWLTSALQASAASPLRVAHGQPVGATVGAMDVPSAFRPLATDGGGDVEALRALRESEERFRTLTEIAPVGIFLTDAAHACIYVNERWSAITGVPPREALGRDWRASLHMDAELLQVTSIFEAEPLQPLTFETRIDRPDGASTWVIGQIRPYRDNTGEVAGHLGVVTDITERKAAEVAMQESQARLRELAKHMTSAEERQRALIAREIHDDIGSSLTGMKIDVARLKQLTVGNDEAQEKLAAFTRLLDSTAAASTRIAKALRPSILDDGIVPAIDWQLREFSKRMDIDAEFTEPAREPKLTPDQSIALFRVVQEALNNVAKHAGARHVDVVLFTDRNELTLEIRDDGRGLPRDADGDRIERNGAFGITGMRERILSLGGWMDITGAPGQGTTVMVGIPMERPA